MKTKIRYLNGSRLYRAFVAGGNAVIRDHSYLNKINVFPVPDADTGTNLASTMRAIAQGARAHLSIRHTFRSMADAALAGAQGNSGIIFAQFLHGLSREVGGEQRLTTRAFAESVRKAVGHAHRAISSPVEGTMITVMRDWAESLFRLRESTADFTDLMSASIADARKSLRETPRKLAVLAKAGVVDAGAKGFVDFLEGILHYIKKGKLARTPLQEIVWSPEETKTPSRDKSIHNRYCSEALLTGTALDVEHIRAIVSRYGDSAVVAGSEERVRLHVHTNDPAGLFFEIKDAGAIAQIKVDDMKKQYEAAWHPKSKTAFVVDSTCDLPAAWVDDRQIHALPCLVTFGEQVFLDKLTISPDRLYGLLAEGDIRPKTAQPALKTVQNTLAYLTGHYESVIILTLSDKLSGVHRTCRTAAAALAGKKITVIDGRTVSAASGLLAARASEMIDFGKSHDEVVTALESWIPKTHLYVDVQTMKYAVRSGRVGRVKGLLARALGLKPVIGVSAEGRLEAAGKSFSRSGNLNGIVRTVEAAVGRRPLWGYALVHVRNPERAGLYAEKFAAALGRPPLFTVEADPAIGVHAGLGAVGVAILHE
ncbi:MAG: DegV family EDD domain-containing protein [Candidatus Aminicenantes bacterium]|nr:DegV family EDD domain-containing protein [Candidatus Aminicenantes bacterium]